MTDNSHITEITTDIDLDPSVELVRDNASYDPRVQGDNSNVKFEARPHDRRMADRFLKTFFRNAAMLQCPRSDCKSETFRIFVDDHDDQPLVMFVCGNTRCGATWKPLKVGAAQVTNAIARAQGFWVPD